MPPPMITGSGMVLPISLNDVCFVGRLLSAAQIRRRLRLWLRHTPQNYLIEIKLSQLVSGNHICGIIKRADRFLV